MMLFTILLLTVTFIFITLMVMSEITLEVELCVAKNIPYPHSSEFRSEVYRALRPRILRRGRVSAEMVESRYRALRNTLEVIYILLVLLVCLCT